VKAMLTSLLIVAVALAAGSWWINHRLDQAELQRLTHSSLEKAATYQFATIENLDSGFSTASANLLLHFAYRGNSRRVPVDLRLERIGSRWHVSSVFVGSEQYASLESLGHRVSMSLFAHQAAQDTGEIVQEAGELLEEWGEIATRESARAAEALRKHWEKMQDNDSG